MECGIKMLKMKLTLDRESDSQDTQKVNNHRNLFRTFDGHPVKICNIRWTPYIITKYSISSNIYLKRLEGNMIFTAPT